MTTLSVTTRSLRGPDGAASAAVLEASARRVLDFGIHSIVLDEDFTLPEWDILTRFFPAESVSAAFAFAPLPRPTPLGKEPPPSLVSQDADEISAARQRLTRQIEFLGSNGVSRVVLPPAQISAPSRTEVRRALGTAEMADLPRVIEQLRRRRETSAAVPQELDSLLRVLDALLQAADRHGVEVSLQPASLPSEMPASGEISTLLAEFGGAPLSVSVNTLGVERSLYCQVEGASTLLETFDERLSSVFVEDGHLLAGKLPVGGGSVGFERWRPIFAGARSRDWVLDLAEGATDDTHQAGNALLEGLSAPPSASVDSNPSPFLDKSLRDLV